MRTEWPALTVRFEPRQMEVLKLLAHQGKRSLAAQVRALVDEMICEALLERTVTVENKNN